MGHTKGPWHETIKQHGLEHPIYTEEALPIAMVRSRDDHAESVANARLIAASPDLLAACKAGLQELESFGHAYSFDNSKNPTMKAMRAAIARAEGTK